MSGFDPFFETLKNTLENTWPMLSLFVVIILIVRLSSIIINKEKITLYKEFYTLLFYLYILLLYHLLLTTEDAVTGINLVPFKEIMRYSFGSRGFMYNVIGNIVLFVPFGFFLGEYLKEAKTHHVIIISAIISLTAESIQHRIGRAFDVDDILLNVIGTLVGYILYSSMKIINNKLPKFLQNDIFYNIIAILIAFIICLVFSRMWGLI